MPVYEYRCDNGHTFEVTQSMSEDALEECTVCGAPARRILFAPAVHFKGSGFYTTDYARKGKGGGSKGANGSDSSKSDSADSKDTKESKSSSDSGSSSSSSSGEAASSSKD